MEGKEANVVYVASSHAILSAVLDLIASAEKSILLQMYLFTANGDQTVVLPRPGAFPYAQLVASRLIEKKRSHPEIDIVVILDTNTPANQSLTRRRGKLIREYLREAGIVVLNANLFDTAFDRKRSFYKPLNFHLDYAKVPVQDWVEHQYKWQALKNVEDHRKNMVIDYGRAGCITSHNFLDPAYDWYENLFWLTGSLSQDLWRVALCSLQAATQIPNDMNDRERSTIERLLTTTAPLSGSVHLLAPSQSEVDGFPLPLVQYRKSADVLASDHPRDAATALIETEHIHAQVLDLINSAKPNDEILLATTYFSDQPVFDAIQQAVQRGVRVRVLIDSLHGLPLPKLLSWLTCNLVNHSLVVQSIELQNHYPERFELRIHQSHSGTMMHLKTIVRLGNSPLLIGGQANFTPNSFSGAYLETDLRSNDSTVISDFVAHFNVLWHLEQCVKVKRSGSLWQLFKQWLCTWLLWLFAKFGLRP